MEYPVQDMGQTAAISALLPPETAVKPAVFACLPSTNTTLKALAEQGAPEGTAVIAFAQTAGRGRRGRDFFSPEGTGLYLSILLRPEIAPERAVSMTTAAAVAVCEAVETVAGIQPGIKWVNDLFWEGRKVCGILTEAATAQTGKLRYAIVGIGLNLFPPEGGFPPDLAEIAGSIWPAGTVGREGLRNRLAAEICSAFFRRWKMNPGENARAYGQRCFVPGKQVTVLSPRGAKAALAVAVDDQCRLLVRYPDGAEELLDSGEISLRVM